MTFASKSCHCSTANHKCAIFSSLSTFVIDRFLSLLLRDTLRPVSTTHVTLIPHFSPTFLHEKDKQPNTTKSILLQYCYSQQLGPPRHHHQLLNNLSICFWSVLSPLIRSERKPPPTVDSPPSHLLRNQPTHPPTISFASTEVPHPR